MDKIANLDFLTGKKIVFFLSSFNLGGAERQALHLIRFLKQNSRVELEVFAFSGPGPVSKELDSLKIKNNILNVDFYYINKSAPLRFSSSSLKFHLKTKRELSKVRTALKKTSADLLMPFTYYPNVFCCYLSKSLNVKSTWNQRDLGIEGFNGNRIEKHAARNAKIFISNSEAGSRFLKEKFQTEISKTLIIHNGIELAPSRKTRLEWRNELQIQNEFTLVMVGNFHSNKDHETLLKAFSLLINEKKTVGIKLVLAGKFTGKEKELMQAAGQMKIRDKIIFLDEVSDVSGLLEASDAFVLSSKSEGSSNAVLEAMKCGVPVITSRNSGNAGILGKEYPFLFDAENAVSLSEKIIELMDKGDLRKQISLRNKNKIAEEYSLDHMLESYSLLIKNLLAA